MLDPAAWPPRSCSGASDARLGDELESQGDGKVRIARGETDWFDVSASQQYEARRGVY